MRRPFAASFRCALFVLLGLVLAAIALPAEAQQRSGGGAAKAVPASAKKAQRAVAVIRADRQRSRPVRELRSLRTRDSKTFETADGRRLARVYGTSAHFRNPKGKWQDVDTRLRRAHGRLLNRTTGFSTSLPEDIGADSFRVRRGKWSVGFSVRGAQGKARVRGSEAVYANAFPGVDASYRLLPDSLKETLTLRSREARRRFAFDLEIPKGLRPRMLKTKAVVLLDRRNKARMTFAAPFTIDAKGRRHRVGARLVNVGGVWRLTLTASDRWLDAGNRAWPVRLDPAVYPTGDTDCDFSSATPTASSCADGELFVGRTGTTDWQAVLRFDGVGAAVPRGAEVHGGTMIVHQTGAENANYVYLAARALTEPFTTAASWNSNDGTHRWSEPGGEADTSPDAASEFPAYMSNGEAPGIRFFPLFKVIRGWASGKRANHGVLLTAASLTNGVRYASTNHADPALRPYLEVTYSRRIGDRRGYVHERQRLSDRISLGVNLASGNLNVSQSDFTMPGGLGPAVAATRSYNSMEQFSSAFGFRWKLNTGPDFRIWQQNGGQLVMVKYPGGAHAPYIRKSAGNEYATPPGYDNKLTRNDTTGTYELTDNKSQTRYQFGDYTVEGRLNKLIDRNGRELNFVYNTANELIRVDDSNNDASLTTDDLRFASTSGRITTMTEPGGRAHAYGYTGMYLTSYTDPQNGASFKTLYEYGGADAQMTKITTPQGNVTTIDYYPEGHEDAHKVKSITRVTDTATMTGPRTEFAYHVRRDGSGYAEVTDPLGVASADDDDRVTRSDFDDQGRVTKTIDALGRETARKLTSNSNVQSYTAAGNTGTTPNTSFTYDESTNNLTATSTPTTAAGGDPMTTSAGYGGAAGGGTVNAGTSGSAYLPTRGTNEQGGVTKTNYNADTKGNPSGVGRYTQSDALVSAVSMQYRPVTSTNPLDPAATDGKEGQLKSISDGRGKVTLYGYDAKGNVNSVDPPGSGTHQLGTTSMLYDQNLGRIERVRDGRGNCRWLFYDSFDRVIRIEFRGACTSVTDTAPVLDSHEPKVEFTYDRDGNQLTEVSREEVAPGGTGATRTRTMTYDKLNRVINEALPGGASNAYTYDLVGNLRTLTDAGGKVEYTYDAVNQQRAVYEPGTTAPTKFVHNKDGLRESTTYPNKVSIAWKFDHANRVEKITSKAPNGTTVLQELAYKYRQPSGANRQTPLRYEAHDTVLNRRTRYDYDGLDRLVDATTKTATGTDTDTGWAGVTTPIARYGYQLDGAGNVVQRVLSGSGVTADTRNFAYDEGNQLCWRSPTSGAVLGTGVDGCAAGTRQTAFDGSGNETAGASGTNRTAAYHLNDQTKSITISGSPTAFVYLGTGQGRWATEGSASFQHSVLGLGSRAVGTTADYFTRDEGGGLVSRRNGTTRNYYLFDALGSVTGLVDSAGSVSHRYDYEPYGGKETSTGTTAPNADVPQGQFGFAGGYRSVGGTYHYGQRYYDPLSMHWTQTDPLDQAGDLREGNRYLYAAADPIGLTDPSGMKIWDDAWDGVKSVAKTTWEYGIKPCAIGGAMGGARSLGSPAGAAIGCAGGITWHAFRKGAGVVRESACHSMSDPDSQMLCTGTEAQKE